MLGLLLRIRLAVPVGAFLASVVALSSAAALASGPAPGRADIREQTAQAQGQQRPGERQQPPPSAERYLGGSSDLWWQNETIRKEVGLDAKQVREISWIFESRVKQITPYHDEYRRQLAELERLTRERVVDEGTYALQVSRVEGLRSKLSETRTVMLYTIYRKLTPAQYQKLQEVRDRMRRGNGSAPRPW